MCNRCGGAVPHRDRTYCDACFALPQALRRAAVGMAGPVLLNAKIRASAKPAATHPTASASTATAASPDTKSRSPIGEGHARHAVCLFHIGSVSTAIFASSTASTSLGDGGRGGTGRTRRLSNVATVLPPCPRCLYSCGKVRSNPIHSSQPRHRCFKLFRGCWIVATPVAVGAEGNAVGNTARVGGRSRAR